MRRFTEGDRVMVTAAAANHKGEFGTVKKYYGDNNVCCVELDGGCRTNFLDTSLKLFKNVKAKKK